MSSLTAISSKSPGRFSILSQASLHSFLWGAGGGNRRSHLFWDQHTTNFGATNAPILDFGH